MIQLNIICTKNTLINQISFFGKWRKGISLVAISQKIAIVGIFLMTFSTAGFSQNIDKEKHYNELIYIEADPLAYINKGYSIHLGYENWGWRFDLTKVHVDFPESFEEAFYDTKAFDLVTNIHGIKLDYIGNRSNWTKNAFVGLDINHQRLSLENRESAQSKDLHAFYVGMRVGYKFPIWKGLYVTPWAAVWRNVWAEQEFSVGNDKITTNKWDWITTFHVGYAYKF